MTKKVIVVSPRFYTILKQAYADLDTDNSDLLKNGRVGRYGSVIVKMSNNVATANGGLEDKIMLRTASAIAHIRAMTHTEAYRPEDGFADAVKGFILWGNKIVRPKELVVINAKYA
jgi:hypothetical protein